MEREARLKEERDPNESQNVSCTSSGFRPRLLENSQKKKHLEPRLGNITEKTPKHFKSKPKMTLKWPQNGAKTGPKMVQGGRRTPKKNLKINSPILGRPRAPKSTPKLTLKS